MLFVATRRIPELHLFAYLIDRHSRVLMLSAVHVLQSSIFTFWRWSFYFCLISLTLLDLRRISLSPLWSVVTLRLWSSSESIRLRSLLFTRRRWSFIVDNSTSNVLVYPTSVDFDYQTSVVFDHQSSVVLVYECPPTIFAVSVIRATIVRFGVMTLQSNCFATGELLMVMMLMFPHLLRQRFRLRAIWFVRRSVWRRVSIIFRCSSTLGSSPRCTKMVTRLTSSMRAVAKGMISPLRPVRSVDLCSNAMGPHFLGSASCNLICPTFSVLRSASMLRACRLSSFCCRALAIYRIGLMPIRDVSSYRHCCSLVYNNCDWFCSRSRHGSRCRCFVKWCVAANWRGVWATSQVRDPGGAVNQRHFRVLCVALVAAWASWLHYQSPTFSRYVQGQVKAIWRLGCGCPKRKKVVAFEWHACNAKVSSVQALLRRYRDEFSHVAKRLNEEGVNLEPGRAAAAKKAED